jgi:hypothetical protein
MVKVDWRHLVLAALLITAAAAIPWLNHTLGR